MRTWTVNLAKKLGFTVKETREGATADRTPATLPSEVLFGRALDQDTKLRDLYNGAWTSYSYRSRSEAELALICKLVGYGFSDADISSFMERCTIGKWQGKEESYHRITIEKARRYIAQHALERNKNNSKKKSAERAAWSTSRTPDGRLRVLRNPARRYECEGCDFETKEIEEARQHQEQGKQHWFQSQDD